MGLRHADREQQLLDRNHPIDHRPRKIRPPPRDDRAPLRREPRWIPSIPAMREPRDHRLRHKYPVNWDDRSGLLQGHRSWYLGQHLLPSIDKLHDPRPSVDRRCRVRFAV